MKQQVPHEAKKKWVWLNQRGRFRSVTAVICSRKTIESKHILILAFNLIFIVYTKLNELGSLKLSSSFLNKGLRDENMQIIASLGG